MNPFSFLRRRKPRCNHCWHDAGTGEYRRREMPCGDRFTEWHKEYMACCICRRCEFRDVMKHGDGNRNLLSHSGWQKCDELAVDPKYLPPFDRSVPDIVRLG